MSIAFLHRVWTSARFISGDWRGLYHPEEVIFEVTTGCNLACPMCARTHLADEGPVKTMSLESFEFLAGRLPASVERVAIAGLGEPLLNRDLPNMVGALTSLGLGSVLYTNATLLTPEVSRRLVMADLSGIVIPMDGATPATYERHRKNADFAVTIENVRQLLAAKREAESDLFVELQMLRLPGTEGELDAWRRMWTVPGVDALRYKPDHMGAGPGAESAAATARGVCPMLWRGPATVDVEGNVYPCCVQSPENVILGNLYGQEMGHIWNGAAARDMRRQFVRTRRKLESCKGCLIPLPPVPVSAAGNLLNPFAARKVMARLEPLMAKRHKRCRGG